MLQLDMKHSITDEEVTVFRTLKSIFCYKGMPFGLKNAGATYQWAMTYIFEELFHDEVECYMDNLVVKTKLRNDHIQDLDRVFQQLRKCNLNMNPLKCAFRVSAGKFLGSVVRHRGIEIVPKKITTILKMPPPQDLTELKRLQGRLAYIRQFISNLTGRLISTENYVIIIFRTCIITYLSYIFLYVYVNFLFSLIETQ